MSERQRFHEIVNSIREDLKLIKSMQDKLYSIIPNVSAYYFPENVVTETKEWIIDTYLDKFFETDTKIKKLLKTLEVNYESIIKEAQRFNENLREVALNFGVLLLPKSNKKELKFFQSATKPFVECLSTVNVSFKLYSDEFDRAVINASNILHQTDWFKMKNVVYEDYILPTKRKKYVKAREELEKAKQMVKTGDWEETLNHIRPSIDIALTEKLGFDVRNMKTFLIDAEESGLLPSYNLLYSFFDEGSKRLHKGRIHSPLDCQTAVTYIAQFIDQLESMHIPADLIEEYRQKHGYVDKS